MGAGEQEQEEEEEEDSASRPASFATFALFAVTKFPLPRPRSATAVPGMGHPCCGGVGKPIPWSITSLFCYSGSSARVWGWRIRSESIA